MIFVDDRRRALLPLLCLLAFSGAGCGTAGGVPPIPDPQLLGSPGRGVGSFYLPRAIEVLPGGDCFVIDRSGRAQHFDGEGTLEGLWWLPEWSQGHPIDLARTPWGTLIVSDTHYQRLIEFDTEGKELRRFGEDADLGLVRGVVVAEDGTIFVADYGESDRIHRFDRTGKHLGHFGVRGDGPSDLLRPEGLAIGEGGDLFVVDCGHHRILRFRPDGTPAGGFGSEGDGEGQFHYPFDIASGSDGSLYVVDFGGHRLQRFTSDGRFTGVFGGPGRAPGKLSEPRGVAVLAGEDGDWVLIADTGNHRVQRFRWPGNRG